MKKYIFMLLVGLMSVSCVDTVILPNDKTVEEDFWKSKEDVKLMVNGAYRSMLSSDVVARLIVWGGLRSDEFIPVASITGNIQEDLTEINLANTQPDNTFATWNSFYSVINNCNLVLDRAASVMGEDPSYTEGDYLSDCSQMLALRALCYFYLVRNFRDVPYSSEAFKNSSQERNIPQSAPDSVLAVCIKDLETAEKNAISASAYNNWKRVGYFTRDGIDALLADIYLWRGSVMHNPADYEQAIEYCDKVIASKKSMHVLGFGETEIPEYPLLDGRSVFNKIYVDGNAEESIFELQFDGTNNTNVAIAQYFNHYNGRDNTVPYLYASDIFQYGKDVYKTGNYTNDWRGLMNTYNSPVTVGDLTGLEIRKYVSSGSDYNPNSPSAAAEKKNTTYTSTLSRNYIIYRLTDIMLMKAEALMALASGDDDEAHLQAAFELVEKVNTRSRESDVEKIKWNTYNTVEKMEDLILAERLRELAFEGKRWYDLLRYHYRHAEGVNYSKTLAALNDEGSAFVTTYQPMLDLMKRKMASKGNAVAAKMNTEPKLYLPIPLSDMSICPVLRQNPAYSSAEDFNKNY